MKLILFIIIALSVFWTSCRKPQKFSEIPELKFISIPLKDTHDTLGNPIRRAQLTFYLVDGNGDIGFNEGDTLPPYQITGDYYYNLFIEMYELKNGNFTLVDLAAPFYFRTTNIEPVGQNKTLKCTIYVNLDFYIPVIWDSVKFDFYMYDRALHKSNIASTGLMLL
ncbi:MAG: hypothetical protein COX07_05055 [Bacteroidetes bacterium CG23_combo_of_CG06-09_8_20_14_all_32_9]|nr:MAG: hypothetical protein COX07_05055 [Bacteroidetes bacterium CG23_combo_of_CG06-09_8_20_14_all_32_9]